MNERSTASLGFSLSARRMTCTSDMSRSHVWLVCRSRLTPYVLHVCIEDRAREELVQNAESAVGRMYTRFPLDTIVDQDRSMKIWRHDFGISPG
jgi:hypothetical protein